MKKKSVPKSALTKREVSISIARSMNLPQVLVQSIMQSTLDIITESLVQGRHVEFRDFGVFRIVKRKARIGRNPNQPENIVKIPARKTVKFKPGKEMRQRIGV